MRRILSFTPLILVFLISLLFTSRLFRSGLFYMYDDMQVIRVLQMDKCMMDVQIPCRWVPDLGLGFGYPLYIYYAPLPYYFMEIIHAVGISFISSVKVGFIASVFISALFFYLFSKRFLSGVSAIVASLVFVFLPFRASDL